MANTLPSDARLSNAYGLEDGASDVAPAAIKRLEDSQAARAGARRELGKGAALAAVGAAAALSVSGALNEITDNDHFPPAIHAEPNGDVDTTPYTGQPLTATVAPNESLLHVAADIEAQPGNEDLTVEGIKEDLVALNGGSAAVQATQSVLLPPYARDMRPDLPGTQLEAPKKDIGEVPPNPVTPVSSNTQTTATTMPPRS